jgi:hypothetical protein
MGVALAVGLALFSAAVFATLMWFVGGSDV